MYHGLWINGPKEAGIELPDFPFDAETPSYFKADRMLKYLLDYCDAKKINELIHCHKNVQTVKYCDDKAQNCNFCFTKFAKIYKIWLIFFYQI